MEMKPIVLIHGYSADGKDNSVEEIYGRLPADLRKAYGDRSVVEIDLSRWISLEDGIAIDDIAFALDRALKDDAYAHLLEEGFHVIIHSTGALVTRTWIRKHSPKPCPIINLVHLAGANFGSGLAHIGRGTAARWGRQLFEGTEAGVQVLRELEFGSTKSLDLHVGFLEEGERMLEDYGVQEFCIIGSQIPDKLRLLPVRYIKEDSSDCTVRTAAGNLNFNYVRLAPKPDTESLPFDTVQQRINLRREWRAFKDSSYAIQELSLAGDRTEIPYAIPFETAHLGDKIGIVYGSKNRGQVMPLVRAALNTPGGSPDRYAQTVERFRAHTAKTFERAAKLTALLHDPQAQYEGHAQLIFRLRDQNGRPVEYHDIYFESKPGKGEEGLERMIEDKHQNSADKGTVTYYLRLQRFKRGNFGDRLAKVAPLNLEITGHEPETDKIVYLPMRLRLTPEQLRTLVQPFRTTVVDVTLLRLPSGEVFELKSYG